MFKFNILMIFKGLVIILLAASICMCQETINDIIKETKTSCINSDKKEFPKINLSYITPWNKEGLDLALANANKIDLLSPCWFELKPETLNGKFNIKIEGSDNVDNDFIIKIKEKNANIKIVPRFNCQNFSAEHFIELYKPDNTEQFIKVLMRRLKYNRFNGIVLECNQVWLIDKYFPNFTEFARKLSDELHKEKMLLLTTIFPFSENVANYLSKQRLEYLSRYVDYFNLMTYDYISHLNEKSQSNFKLSLAPVTWIKKSLDHYIDAKRPTKDLLYRKILLGLPFHGFVIDKTSSKPKGFSVDGKKIIQFLGTNTDSKLIWDDVEKEHLIDLTVKDQMFLAAYPTRKFLKERIDLVLNANLAGIGLWDIAQGLECYLDLF